MKQKLLGIGLIVLVVAIAQGRSVGYGLLLDDYNHRAQLQAGDGSVASLIEAAHLGDPSRRVRMWWQERADLHFCRPLAFLLMRLEYVIGHWRPAWMHLCSLGWAVLSATLVMTLARQVTKSNNWSVLAGVLFVLHPANQLTIRWVACQNEQMAATFMLAGLLCYSRWAGWGDPPDPTRKDRRRTGYLLGTLACFVAALGCRETAVMFGPMLVLGDWALGPRKSSGRWTLYAIFAGLTLGYLALRAVALDGFSLPGPPYIHPPSAPGFARFIVDKFIYYLLGLFAYLPIIGFTGLDQLRAHPVLSYGGFGLIALGLVAVLYGFLQRGWL